MTGGAGADQFVFRINDIINTITDFIPGHDHIDLSAILAIETSKVDQWLSSHAATSPINPADVLLTLDADRSIILQHLSVGGLHASDFIFSPHA